MNQSASTGYTPDQRDRYCRCTVGEFSKMDFDRYLVVNGEVLEERLSAETKSYLENVHAACEGQLLQ